MALALSAVAPTSAPCETSDGLLDALGAEVTVALLATLDAPSLARCAAVSRSWRVLATDDTLWMPLCRQLWRSKSFVPRRFKILLDLPVKPPRPRHAGTLAGGFSSSHHIPVCGVAESRASCLKNEADCESMLCEKCGALCSMEREPAADLTAYSEFSEPLSWAVMYRESLCEGAREGILAEELCSVTWSFRFKHMDLPWIRNHPFWLNLPPLLRKFHLDGSVASDTRNDPIYGSHENIWRFVPSSAAPPPPPPAAAGGARSGYGWGTGNGGEAARGTQGTSSAVIADNIRGSCACASRSSTQHAAPAPAAAAAAAAAAAPVASMRVRINHWPALTVVRRADWGWDMANEYVVYCSLPQTP